MSVEPQYVLILCTAVEEDVITQVIKLPHQASVSDNVAGIDFLWDDNLDQQDQLVIATENDLCWLLTKIYGEDASYVLIRINSSGMDVISRFTPDWREVK